MTPSSTSSPPFEINFKPLAAKTGSRTRTRPTLHPSWVQKSTGPFDYSPDSDQPSSQASPTTWWMPLPGPQTVALDTLADETLYGGAAGGGKTDLLLGLGLTKHQKGVIFRREYGQLADIVLRGNQIVGPEHFHGTALRWRIGGRQLELGAAQHAKDVAKWRGRPHDFKGFDELSEFTEEQYLFLSGWARTTTRGQRVRIVGASNPPSTAEGEWLIIRWAPWLDEQHPNPAAPGELRWFARLDGKDTEVAGPGSFEYGGETIYPKSRTFIPARLADNPYLSADPSYRATLQALPEPLRSQLLYGDFKAGRVDDPFVVIPTEWIRAAQARWSPDGALGAPLACLGVDVARGGKDRTVLAPRHGTWFGPLSIYPGVETPDGLTTAALIGKALTGQAVANVDVIGYGSSAYDTAKMLGYRVWPVNAGAGAKYPDGTPITDRSGRMAFANVRSAMYWTFREALDPSAEAQIALPPSRKLLADLAAPTWELRGGRIWIESKDDISARLGRSPDEGDAVVMAHWLDPLYLLSIQRHAPRRRALVVG
jgi:hypothetical protein